MQPTRRSQGSRTGFAFRDQLRRNAGPGALLVRGVGARPGVDRLLPLSEPAARGRERIRFMAPMNPGFPPARLSRIASSGELSRVMLTLKSILAGIDGLPTLVFDEIGERAEWDCGGGRGRKDKVRGRKDMEDEHIGPHLARHRRKVRQITHPDPKGIEHGSHQAVVASPCGHNVRAGAASPAAQWHRNAEELPPVSSPLIREPLSPSAHGPATRGGPAGCHA